MGVMNGMAGRVMLGSEKGGPGKRLSVETSKNKMVAPRKSSTFGGGDREHVADRVGGGPSVHSAEGLEPASSRVPTDYIFVEGEKVKLKNLVRTELNELVGIVRPTRREFTERVPVQLDGWSQRVLIKPVNLVKLMQLPPHQPRQKGGLLEAMHNDLENQLPADIVYMDISFISIYIYIYIVVLF